MPKGLSLFVCMYVCYKHWNNLNTFYAKDMEIETNGRCIHIARVMSTSSVFFYIVH